MAECVECGADLEVPKRVSIGELMECPECEVMLEVIDIDPVTLEVAAAVEDMDEGSAAAGDVEEDEDWLQ